MFRVEEDTGNAIHPEILKSHFKRGISFPTTPCDPAPDVARLLIEAERKRQEALKRIGNPNQNPVKIFLVKTSRLPNRTIRIK